ncbi:MAG: hemerythrin domain-containing protein [Pseudobdellovibrionaceae bacterium]
MERNLLNERRNFLISSVALGAGTLIPTSTLAKESREEVGPAEDLMREHGALNRILLIYEEGLRHLNSKSDFDTEVLKKSAKIIKSFIEDYHEKLEEEFVFPRLKKAAHLVDLVDTLEVQHKAGRKLTATIEQLSNQATLKNESDSSKLKTSMESFLIMYRPHESREDTVLFPAFHEMLDKKVYEKLGKQFEDREHKLFGKEGFEGVVKQIEGLEKEYGIYELSKFTPSP